MDNGSSTAGLWPFDGAGHFWAYWLDSCQRSVLFWDTLRQRGNAFLEHRRAGKPAVLDFDADMIIDGRTLDAPANYALLSIVPPDDCTIDPGKRPFVIIDPRAGHGPGIGGFKYDSQIGVALRAGHAVYFVTFFPEPVPSQTLLDVANAEALFIEEVARRHPEAEGKPCVIGNCQAGWAVASLASIRPEIMGPILLNGAPLSYWAGVDGQNPMRYAGGLLGGMWLASLLGDLGNGRFDGTHLVANFENLNPANTLWSKQYNLYARIDTEAPRYLDFEKWWGGFFLMNAEEMEAIVSELFIGNKLARGEVSTNTGSPIDLKNIRSPIIVFASFGDDITPPQQALNWIVDIYGHEDHIVENDDVIVYLLHEHIGHLGIFVSSRVARKETTELVGTLEMIDRLPPGLYEMIIEAKQPATRRADLVPGDYTVRFETRSVQDILALDDGRQDEDCFAAVAAVSELNDSAYRAFVRPWVRLMTNEHTAEWGRRLHPKRLERSLLSDLNPLLAPLAACAAAARAGRQAVSEDNPFLQMERTWSDAIVAGLDACRDIRDQWNGVLFKSIYGPCGLGALFPPPAPGHAAAQELTMDDDALRRWAETEGRFESGGPLAAMIRMLVMVAYHEGGIERRSMRIAREWRLKSRFAEVSAADMKQLVHEQADLLRLDEQRALQALPKMLPTRHQREEAIDYVCQVMMDDPEIEDPSDPLIRRLSDILEIDVPASLSASGRTS